MALVPSSDSWLNNASLVSCYLSFMFCAFPKSLSKRSGLGLRVTSNDNLFAVICVYKQPKTFRTPIQHLFVFYKKKKEINRKIKVFKVNTSIKEGVGNSKEKGTPPCPTIQHAEQAPSDFTFAGWFEASTCILSHPVPGLYNIVFR